MKRVGYIPFKNACFVVNYFLPLREIPFFVLAPYMKDQEIKCAFLCGNKANQRKKKSITKTFYRTSTNFRVLGIQKKEHILS